MLKVNTQSGAIWINPAHVIWFWDYQGKCHVALTDRDDMLEIDGMNADVFAALIDGAR